MSKQNVILVGRHNEEVRSEYNVIEVRNILFPATRKGTIEALREVIVDAKKLDAKVLLQAVPGILAASLTDINEEVKGVIGIVISQPAPRESSVTQEYDFTSSWGDYYGQSYGVTDVSEKVLEAMLFMNPNIKYERIPVEQVTSSGLQTVYKIRITVDPTPKFKLDHIEWL